MRRLLVLAVLGAAIAVGGCKGDETKAFGAACGPTDTCDGFCLIGPPGNMCTSFCVGNPPQCLKGGCSQSLQDIDGNRLCAPSCTSDANCRAGYICSQGVCEPPLPVGFACEESSDCAGNQCEGGFCTAGCTSHEDCPDGFQCAKQSTGDLRCSAIPADEGPGTLGHSCGVIACNAGFTCIETEPGDPNSYCSKQCVADADCAPNMICRPDLNGTSFCFVREFCEECEFDAQCGFQNERCVAADPAVAAGNYCSTACDPGELGTCPTDSSCLEAFLCADDNTWVSDCNDCSGACTPGSPTVHQCFKDYGACVGDGSLCTPCRHDGQCNTGPCIAGFSDGNLTCSGPCDQNCGDGFICVRFTGQPNSQCVPRSGSCSNPSDSGEVCSFCSTFADCLSGFCGETGTPTFSYCLDSCTGDADCPSYMTCESRLTAVFGNQNVCVPSEIKDGSCTRYQSCETDCPNGPESCSAGAHVDCRAGTGCMNGIDDDSDGMTDCDDPECVGVICGAAGETCSATQTGLCTP